MPRASPKDVEQRELEFSCTSAGNAKLYNCFEKQFGISCKIKHTFTK